MNHHAHPLDSLIDFAWSAGADRFWINNAKDELKQLRSKVEEINRLLSAMVPVAWAKINDSGDLYDLRLQNNPYYDQTKIVPLYRINHD